MCQYVYASLQRHAYQKSIRWLNVQAYDPCSWKFEARKSQFQDQSKDLIPNTSRKRKIIINLLFSIE